MGLSDDARKATVYCAMFGRASKVTSDNLAFFPELNLVFNRIKKSGNSSIFLFLEDLVQGHGREDRDVNALKKRRSIQETDYANLINVRRLSSLVCVRRPDVRVLSGFLHLVAGKHQRFEAVSGYGEPTAAGFEAFLEYLTERDIRTLNKHFWRQTDLLFQPLSEFTFVLKLEEIVSGMKTVLEELNRDPELAETLKSPHPTERALANKITNSRERRDLITPRSRALIEKIYASDFEQLDY